MTNLETIRAALKRQIVDSLDETFHQLDAKLAPDSEKFNEFIQINGRYKNLLREVVAGTLASASVDVIRNQIIQSLLLLIDSLEEGDLKTEATTAPPAAKRGEVLYRIPDQMQVGHEEKCTVRIAWVLDQLLRDWQKSDADVIKNIRVADIMGVYLLNLDESNPFNIRTLSEPVQFLDPSDFTEWIFYVKPLRTGQFPLVLRVSVIELLHGKEYKKDIVLEEQVVVVAEDMAPKAADGSFSRLGEQIVVGSEPGAPQPQSKATHEPPAMPSEVTSPSEKRGVGGMAALLIGTLAVAALGIFVGPIVWQEMDWNKTKRENSQAAYRRHLEKYPDGRHQPEAEAALQAIEKAIRDSILRITPVILDPENVEKIIPEKVVPVDSLALADSLQKIENQKIVTEKPIKPGTKPKPRPAPNKPAPQSNPANPAGPSQSQPAPPTQQPTNAPETSPPPANNAELQGKVFYFGIPVFQLSETKAQAYSLLFYKFNEENNVRLVLYSNGPQRLATGDQVVFYLDNGQTVATPILYVGLFPDKPILSGGYFGLSVADLELLSNQKCKNIRVSGGQVTTFGLGKSAARELNRNARKAVERLKQ